MSETNQPGWWKTNVHRNKVRDEKDRKWNERLRADTRHEDRMRMFYMAAGAAVCAYAFYQAAYFWITLQGMAHH